MAQAAWENSAVTHVERRRSSRPSSPLFGNNTIRKGLFYSITVLPAVLADHILHFLRVFGPGLCCQLESTLSRFLRVFGPGLYCSLESSGKDQLLRPHSCMPPYNLLASRVMCALPGGILTAIFQMPHNTRIFLRILGPPVRVLAGPFALFLTLEKWRRTIMMDSYCVL